MAHPVCEVLLTEKVLAAPSGGAQTETGAIVDFWGVVREREGEAIIAGIVYEAHHAMAEHQLLLIGRDAGARFPLMQILIHHRIGFVSVGEASLFVRIGSRHRAEAFRAIEWTVDELKKRVPIWKRPRLVTGATAQAELTSSAS